MLDTSTEKHEKLRTELSEYASRRGNEGPYADNLLVDALIVGAGFSESSFCTAFYDKLGLLSMLRRRIDAEDPS